MNISSLVLRTPYLWVVLAAAPVFPQARPLDTARSSIIKPISIAGGTVKVKDELKLEFEIFAK